MLGYPPNLNPMGENHHLPRTVHLTKNVSFPIIAPTERLYAQKNNGGKCQSGALNHQNGQNDVLITYCTRDWLAKFGFVPACIYNCNLSYHGSAEQLCTQGRNDILVRGDCRPC